MKQDKRYSGLWILSAVGVLVWELLRLLGQDIANAMTRALPDETKDHGHRRHNTEGP